LTTTKDALSPTSGWLEVLLLLGICGGESKMNAFLTSELKKIDALSEAIVSEDT
jgi:hypothetical protein